MPAEKDLVSFPLYVHRIISSEFCSTISAEEFGTYMWLLVHAAAKEKDASLPDDEQALAQMARVRKVSPRVLAQFPVVETEWGKRRRNAVQHEIWQELQGKVAQARKAAKKRWADERAKKPQ